MSTNEFTRENLYPTDEELFISHAESLPIISSLPSDLHDSSSDRNDLDQTTYEFFSKNQTYTDGQIIPWRKLYSKQRIEESALQSSLTSSSTVKFLVKNNRWPIIIISSIIISLLAIILDWSSTWLNDIKYGYCTSNLFNVRESCSIENWHSYKSIPSTFFSSLINLFLVSSVSIILALIGLKISKSSIWISKSGISELKMIISGHVNNQFLQPSIIILKFISLIFVCSCGGLLVGYEGPLIHISCGVISFVIDRFASFSVFFQYLNNEAIKREIISIGFVIGISLAFKAPIGGLLFSIENLKLGTKINYLAWNGFVCSSIATFIFVEIHPFKKISIIESFSVDIANGWILFETLPYIFVGFVCGILSILFIKLHLKLIDLRNQYKSANFLPKLIYDIINNQYLEISILVIITHILTYPVGFSHLTLNDMLTSLFYDCTDNSENNFNQAICKSSHQLLDLSYYFLLIFVLSNYSYILDIPGGMLLPSLTIGGTIGRIIGELVQIVQTKWGSSIFFECYKENKKCVSPGSYAIVGAASFFASFTNTSVAAVVIVFELTGAVTYLIPLMLGVVVSKTVIDIFGNKGFDELWLMKIRKFYINPELTETMSLAYLSEVPISEAIDDYDPHIIYVDDELLTVSQLLHNVENIYGISDETKGETSNDGFVLLKSKYNRVLVGWINFNDLNNILKYHNYEAEKLVSFSTQLTESELDNVIKLDSYILPTHELTIVNGEYSLLSAYELMNRMLITNIFVCNSNKDGQGFEGILRLADLAKLIKK